METIRRRDVRRFTWKKNDVVFEKEPGRPPLLTPEEREIAKAELQKYREEVEGTRVADGRVIIHRHGR